MYPSAGNKVSNNQGTDKEENDNGGTCSDAMAEKSASLSHRVKKRMKLARVSHINKLYQVWERSLSELSSLDSNGARKPTWCVRVLVLGALAVIMAASIVALLMAPPPRPLEDDRYLARQHAAPLSVLEENHFARLSRSLNRMADPCQDFYAYVCANWEPPRDVFVAPWKRSPLPGWEWTNTASGPAGGSASVRRVSAALTKCWRVFTDRHETQPELVRALRSLGVPVNPRRWEILDRPLDVLVRLSLRAALPVTLLAEPTADLRAPGQMIVLLAKGRIYQQWAEARLAKEPKALQAAAELIGGARYARDVVYVESVVSRWTDTFASDSAGSEPEYLTVRSLALRTPGISVHDWLRAMNQGPPVYVNAADDVYVLDQYGVQLTQRIDAEFGGTRRREVTRWIAALVFHYLAPATSFNLMLRFGRPPQRSCYEYALTLAPYALVTQAARRRVWPEEARAAKTVYERVRDVVKHSLADWMASRAARNEAEARVDALNVVLGVPEHLSTAAGLDAEYDYLEGFHGVFIRDLLRSLKAKAKRAARLFNASQSTPVANLRTAMYSGAPHPSIGEETFFVPYYHVIVVPPRFLTPPFVLINSSAASYGGFGHVVGAAMLEAFDSHGLTLSHQGIRADWLDSTTRDKWTSKRNCLLRRYATSAAPLDVDYSRNTLDENYADVAGYEAALRALRGDPSYRPHEESPVAELSNEQLFYVSLCYKWCSRAPLHRAANDTTRTRPHHKCNIALPTVAGFANAFGCAQRLGGLGLRLVDLHVPGAVRSGEPVQLRCEYDLENAELYSVKWYKNNVEFYRYLPSDVPPGQSYELLGTFVDHSRSDKNNVFLEKTDLNTEGMYGCEVSTEGPGFKTVKGERELRIYVLPEEGPVMEGFQPRYQVGDQVNITCFSRPSKPIATLKWFVNNNAVPAKYETRAGTTRHENGLQSTSTTLHFEVRPEHVSRDVIRFKCTSFVTQAHSRSSEELVIGDKGPPSGRAPQESNSPRILSEKSRYEVGDDVDVNCTSIITEHPVELRWFVNDHEVKGPEAVRFPNVRYADGTQAAVLGLRFRVEARHFSDSDGLRLKCTATQSRVVALSSEETVQGAHQRSSGFRFASDRAISSLDGGHIARLFCCWWILKTLRSVL